MKGLIFPTFLAFFACSLLISTGVTIAKPLKPNTNSTRILFITTNTNKMGSSDILTGNYLPELAHPYNLWVGEGYSIDFASPLGGLTPLDPLSLEEYKNDEECNAFLNNTLAMEGLRNTRTLDNVSSSDYAAIFYPGGVGPMFDLADNVRSHQIAREAYESGRIVSAVCHGSVGLVNVRLSNGQFLISGRNVTGFSNAEEDAMGWGPYLPFLLETQIIANGGLYTKAPELWEPEIVVDGRIVTGQNPASASGMAHAMLQVLASV